MLSSKVFNIFYLVKNNTLLHPANVNFLSTSSRVLHFISPEEQNYEQNNKRKLKEWRQPLLPLAKDRKVYDPDKGFFSLFKKKIPITPWGLRQYIKGVRADNEKSEQKFNKVRHEIFGHDLSLAYFLLPRNGKVKFKGHNEWTIMTIDNWENLLPNKFDPNYIIEEVDVSNCLLYYESLENFEHVKRIKRVIFKNSPFFDDWFMDKISTIFPRLEYLDVSNCPKLTERGLEGLYRSSNLQKLIITNYRKTAAFELTSMMLEDCLPNLKIEILDPPNEEAVVKKI